MNSPGRHALVCGCATTAARAKEPVANFSFLVSNEIYMGNPLTSGLHYNFHSDQPT